MSKIRSLHRHLTQITLNSNEKTLDQYRDMTKKERAQYRKLAICKNFPPIWNELYSENDLRSILLNQQKTK
jgi:hypothetical protein